MFSFRSIAAAVCACTAASFATLTSDCVAGERKEPPKFVFKSGDVAKALKKCPDGKARVEVIGSVAQLSDTETGKPIGGRLVHDKGEINGYVPDITCWAFSPDGKLIATGSRSWSSPIGQAGSEGQICVWEVATGKRVADYRGGTTKKERIGNVTGVTFSKDGSTVFFKAEAFEADGP